MTQFALFHALVTNPAHEVAVYNKPESLRSVLFGVNG
jgi:hypothetical protein